MANRLVWLFEEHRRLHAEKIQQEKDLAVIMEKYLRSEDDNKRLAETLEKMGIYIREMQTQSPIDMFERYQKQILQDEPYSEGKIPDDAWLTPGDTIREENVDN